MSPQQRKIWICSCKQVRYFEMIEKESQDYKEKLKIELLLPVNDEVHCKKIVHWKTKSVLH